MQGGVRYQFYATKDGSYWFRVALVTKAGVQEPDEKSVMKGLPDLKMVIDTLKPIVKSIQQAENSWLDVVLASDGEPVEHERFIRVQHLEDFPYRLSDNVRFGDLDPNQHVNNAVYATYFETGRVTLMKDRGYGLVPPGLNWIMVRLDIHYVQIRKRIVRGLGIHYPPSIGRVGSEPWW